MPTLANSLVSKLALADTQPAFRLASDGKQEWGPGGAGVLDTALYRPSAKLLTVDSSLATPQVYAGGSGYAGHYAGAPSSYGGLGMQGLIDGAAKATIWHNAHYNAGAAAGSLVWNQTHGSFGSRGIEFNFADGISFYADVLAATGGSAATITRRLLIGNDGVITIDGTLTTPGIVTVGGIYLGSIDTSLLRGAAGYARSNGGLMAQASAITALLPQLTSSVNQHGGIALVGMANREHPIIYGYTSSWIAQFATKPFSATPLAAWDATNYVKLAVDAAGQLWWFNATGAPDTNLYRQSGGLLKTDGGLVLNRAVGSGFGLLVVNPGDNYGRLHIDPTGQINWALGGVNNFDTSLYRDGAGILRTPGGFYAGGDVIAQYGAAEVVYIGKRGPAAQAGIVLGDASLYRYASNNLRTPGAVVIDGYLQLQSTLYYAGAVNANTSMVQSGWRLPVYSNISGFLGWIQVFT